MYIYYRISDKGNPKEKLIHAGKYECLLNAIAEFGANTIFVIADNCDSSTIEFIKKCGLSFEETSLGNSASFMYMIAKIIERHTADTAVYLLEDDYIHLPGSLKILEEGLSIADYVTLYDHPDKYRLESNNGNPLNYKKLHTTRVYATANSHWRETDSTTMTFACTVQTLKEDFAVWKKYTVDRNPDDFHGFMELTRNDFSDLLSFFFRRRKREFLIILCNWITRKKMKTLVSSIPAHATHAELQWLSPVVDWNKK